LKQQYSKARHFIKTTFSYGVSMDDIAATEFPEHWVGRTFNNGKITIVMPSRLFAEVV
jgi:hypothetical protein